jgi:hypothetical protein
MPDAFEPPDAWLRPVDGALDDALRVRHDAAVHRRATTAVVATRSTSRA